MKHTIVLILLIFKLWTISAIAQVPLPSLIDGDPQSIFNFYGDSLAEIYVECEDDQDRSFHYSRSDSSLFVKTKKSKGTVYSDSLTIRYFETGLISDEVLIETISTPSLEHEYYFFSSWKYIDRNFGFGEFLSITKNPDDPFINSIHSWNDTSRSSFYYNKTGNLDSTFTFSKDSTFVSLSAISNIDRKTIFKEEYMFSNYGLDSPARIGKWESRAHWTVREIKSQTYKINSHEQLKKAKFRGRYYDEIVCIKNQKFIYDKENRLTKIKFRFHRDRNQKYFYDEGKIPIKIVVGKRNSFKNYTVKQKLTKDLD